ncbi:MAG: voltage-gated potassium channel protein [Terriglobales bacterium]
MEPASREHQFHLSVRPRRWRQAWDWVWRSVEDSRWFPHLPLGIGVGLVGLSLLLTGLPSISALLHGQLTLHSMGAGHLVLSATTIIGLAMVLTSAGLLLRSRFSWIIALALMVLTAIFALHFGHSLYSAVLGWDVALLVALLLFHRAFNRSSLAAGTLFALASSLLLIIYAVFGALYLGQQFAPPIRNLATALYYSVVTMSTVGYGDIVPKTPHARLFAVSIIILGITVFATSISAIIGPLVGGSLQRIVREEKHMTRKDHYIIIGNTSLAYNTYRELRKRQQPCTLIFSQAPAQGSFEGADVVIGDANDLDVLKTAGAPAARAVLAMRADDSENAFIVLAVKELGGAVKTVAAINDGKNMDRVRRVQPDIMLAPQVLGGEILAMALSGETVSSDFVLDRLLKYGAAKASGPR